MSRRSIVEEIEARLQYVPRWRLILGAVLLIPPFSVLGMVFLAYELYNAGKRLREDEDELPSAAESDPDVRESDR